jgi:hypothetical protein
MEGDPRRIAVSFGPQHAPVTTFQVRDAVAETRGYDIVLFIGFVGSPARSPRWSFGRSPIDDAGT